MPRGKRTVFGVFCTVSSNRIGTIRLHKQSKVSNKSWKDFKVSKYCKVCRVRVPVKLKEERHSA